jgi:hypothetical protein
MATFRTFSSHLPGDVVALGILFEELQRIVDRPTGWRACHERILAREYIVGRMSLSEHAPCHADMMRVERITLGIR